MKYGGNLCKACCNVKLFYDSPKLGAARKLMKRAVERSKLKKWPAPDFDENFLLEKIENGFCEITGIEFIIPDEKSILYSHARSPWIPSLDRIDSSKPYTKDNVQMVIYMYNACKGKFSHEDVVRFCKQLAS
jgi:hypothetical protein